MIEKVRISLDDAIRLNEAGVEVECYIAVSAANQKPQRTQGKRTHVHPKIRGDQPMRWSVEGRLPAKGSAVRDALDRIFADLWKNDLTATATAQEIRDGLDHYGSTRNMFSQLVYEYGVLKVVDDDE